LASLPGGLTLALGKLTISPMFDFDIDHRCNEFPLLVHRIAAVGEGAR
jgi:hypothetical protein